MASPIAYDLHMSFDEHRDARIRLEGDVREILAEQNRRLRRAHFKLTNGLEAARVDRFHITQIRIDEAIQHMENS